MMMLSSFEEKKAFMPISWTMEFSSKVKVLTRAQRKHFALRKGTEFGKLIVRGEAPQKELISICLSLAFLANSTSSRLAQNQKQAYSRPSTEAGI
jgi:hypothetical protein